MKFNQRLTSRIVFVFDLLALALCRILHFVFNILFPNIERNPSPNSTTSNERSTLRWKKDHTLFRSASEVGEKPRVDIELDAYIEGNLSTQTILTILDTLEVVVQVRCILVYSL